MELHIRSFRDADLPDVLSLFESCFAGYGGWVVRTAETWRWNILGRPDVHREDILVASDAGRAVGYGVITASGVVLELAVSPVIAAADREAVADALLARLETAAQARGVGTVEIDFPTTDAPVCRVLARRGFRGEPADSLQFIIVDVKGFLQALLSHRATDQAVPLPPCSILLNLSRGTYRTAPQERLLITPGHPPSVAPATAGQDAAVAIQTSISTLAEVVLRGREVREALDAGDITVAPSERVADAVALLSALHFRDPWYIPRADLR